MTKGELQLGQADYRAKTGWPVGKDTTAWATYTFHWQPAFVTWAIDGRPVRTFRQGELTRYEGNKITTWESPNMPMHPSFTVWTDTRPKPFGGALQSPGPYTAQFKDMRMVVCDRPGTIVAGPAWLDV